MNTKIQLFAVSALLITVGASVGAQNAAPVKPTVSSVVAKVADEGNKTCDGLSCVISAVQDAKKSGDTKKMKAALDMAEQQLSTVKAKADKNTKLAMRLKEHMEKVEAQRQKVKNEQDTFDNLFYPTDEFVITD